MKNVKKILMVVTNRDHYDDSHKTGLWLEEFAVPYIDSLAAGYEVIVASPLGGICPLDPVSLPETIPSEWNVAVEVLKSTVKLGQVDYKKYDAIVVPGGHGPLFDLANDSTLAQILGYFAKEDRIIAAVCHGVAGLVSAKTEDGKPLVAGRKMTGFTNAEEKIAQLDQMVPFAVESKLRELGADFVSSDPWSDYVIVDGNLITGQNPQSSVSFSKAILQSLSK